MSNENRSYVRGDILFKVKFTLFTRDEYENLQKSKKQHLSSSKYPSEPVFTDPDDPSVSIPDDNLINFLIQMDEKLDQILLLLSKGEAKKEYQLRQEAAALKKAEILARYYKQYLERRNR